METARIAYEALWRSLGCHRTASDWEDCGDEVKDAWRAVVEAVKRELPTPETTEIHVHHHVEYPPGSPMNPWTLPFQVTCNDRSA